MTESLEVGGALAPLRAGYEPLFQRIRQLAESDARIRALWIHGSVAKGLADAESDLDLMVTVQDDEASAFGAGVDSWINRATPTVFTKVMFGRILLALTPELLRIDLGVETVSELARASDRRRLLVFEKDRVAQTLPAADAPRGPTPAVIESLVTDFIGELSMVTAVLAREDWLFGLESAHRSRTMLHQILVEANRPLPPHGNKQWSSQLTPTQREAFAELPGLTATRDSFLAAKWSTVDLFYALVPEIAERLGARWPVDLEDAVGAYLRKELGYTLPLRRDR